MLNRNGAPLGVLAVGLLVVLATIGIVNGLWSKNLVVNGTVETGDLRVDWDSFSDSDEDCIGGAPTPFNPLFPCEFPEKDVGWAECRIDPDKQIMHFRAYNVYPSFDADCEVHFRNTGSIPFHMIGIAIDPGQGLSNCGADVDPDPQAVQVECTEMTIRFVDNVGVQFDPGFGSSSSLLFHVKQAAEQSDCAASGDSNTGAPFWEIDKNSLDCDGATQVSYEFDVKLCVAQWNEAATYDQCIASDQHEGPGDAVDDPDYDNDYDPNDNCPTRFNPNQKDTAPNGAGDACDGVDNDGDGAIDEADEDDL